MKYISEKSLKERGFECLEYKKTYRKRGNNGGYRYYIYKEKCKNCGEPYLVVKITKRNPGKFCDKFCANRGKFHPLYGTHRSEEWKKEHSKKMMGEKNPHYGRTGENHPMYGIHRFGRDAPAYIDGRTPFYAEIRNLFQYKQWRLSVYRRDNFTCQNCDKVGGKLVAHHFIISFIKICRENNIDTIEKALACNLLWDVDNGTTLCRRCHKKKHKKGEKNGKEK